MAVATQTVAATSCSVHTNTHIYRAEGDREDTGGLIRYQIHTRALMTHEPDKTSKPKGRNSGLAHPWTKKLASPCLSGVPAWHHRRDEY